MSLSIAIGVWIFIHLTSKWFPALPDVHQELLYMLNPANSMSQRLGYYLSILLITLAALGLLISTRLNFTQIPNKLNTLSQLLLDIIERPNLTLILLAVLIVFSWRWYGNIIPISGTLMLIGVRAYILKNFRHKTSVFIWLTLLLGLWLFHIVLPIILPLDYSNTELPLFIFLNEMHYSSVLGPAERLAQGGQIFNNVTINYGWLFPVFISIFGDFNLSDYLRLQQYTNAIFFIFCILSYGKIARWKPHIIFALSLFILPLINNLPDWIAAPNQTGMRYIGISLAMLFLAFSSKLSSTTSAIIGGTLSALCLLFNFETGIIISLALVAFTFFTNDLKKFKDCIFKYLLFIFFGFGTIVIFWIFANHMLATPPKPAEINTIIKYITLFINGLGGAKLETLSLSFIFLVHTGYQVILLVTKWNFRKLNNNKAIKLATSMLILGWLAYYFNRPELRNLWVIFVLYGFLVIPLLHHRYTAQLLKNARKITIPIPILVIMLFIVPQAISNNFKSFTRTYNYINYLLVTGLATKPNYSGIKLKKEIAQLLNLKARYLSKLSDDKTVGYLTAFSFSMPIESGRSSLALPQDAFIEVLSDNDHKLFIKNLQESGPDTLLFDDYSKIEQYNISNWRSYYSRIKRNIDQSYRLEEVTDGWQVYRRK